MFTWQTVFDITHLLYNGHTDRVHALTIVQITTILCFIYYWNHEMYICQKMNFGQLLKFPVLWMMGNWNNVSKHYWLVVFCMCCARVKKKPYSKDLKFNYCLEFSELNKKWEEVWHIIAMHIIKNYSPNVWGFWHTH